MYLLYTIPGSCSTGVHALLNELDEPVEIVLRDSLENYPQIVETNQVPALQTEEGLFTEGAAICLYLLNKHGGDSLSKNTQFIQSLMFNYATLHPAYSKLFSANANMENGEEKSAYMGKLAERVAELWKIINRRLAGTGYLYEGKPSVLDYLLAIYVRWGNAFPEIALPVGDHVLAMVDRVKTLPQFRQAFEREKIDYQIPSNAFPS